MEALQGARPVPFRSIPHRSSCGTPSDDGHQVRFSHRQGCTPTSCACVALALVLVALGATAGVYFGLKFLDVEKKSERVYKGSLVVIDGDKYSPSLQDVLSQDFQAKSQEYKTKIDKLYNNSDYQNIFIQSEILALNRKGEGLAVHFNLHLSPEEGALSAADLYVVLSEEVARARIGVFRGLRIDHDSIQIQERRPPSSADILDRWTPRRQYPGYIEGLTTPPSSHLSQDTSRRCSELEVPFCSGLHYNSTSYPNLVGHQNGSQVLGDLVTFRQVVDFECFPLAREFVCQLLQPDCRDDDIVMPCKDYCEDFWKSCKKLLPKKVSSKLDCSKFPKFSGQGTCHQKPGCSSELKARGMRDRLCDGVVDCEDASDEASCEYCKPGQFQCGDKQCVDSRRRCDSREDCLNGADERNCMAITGGVGPYAYGRAGFLLQNDRSDRSRVCTDNLNDSLPASRRDVLLQGLAVSACTGLNYLVTENVEMRKEVEAMKIDYVQLLDPLASSVTFTQVPCESRTSVYVKCGPSACGLRPAYSARVARGLPSEERMAVHGQWPWHASLFRNGEFACHAVLVADQWILALTSCYDSHLKSTWTARLGTVRMTSQSPFDQEAGISGSVRSPVGSGELTILRLQSPINGSDYVRPACLPGQDYTLASVPCLSLQWRGQKNHLTEVKVSLSRSDCSPKYENETLYDPKLICAVEKERSDQDDCQEEESGSPLLCNVNDKWYVLGVGHQTQSCTERERQYHPTLEHVQWIRHTVESLQVH